MPVYAVGSERGVPYYAMQLIDGCTFAEVLGQLQRGKSPHRAGTQASAIVDGPPTIARSERHTHSGRAAQASTLPASSLGSSNLDRRYIRAVADHGRHAAEALDHAHCRGILHRDIKPANLMLDTAGHLWVTDFGLAQIQGDDRLTITGDLIGTLRYMSPEQALAKRVVIDGRTDIYSLGATLYELLALRPVFDIDDRNEILRRIAHEEPTPLRRLNSLVPGDLATIIHKCLAKEASERYSTAQELANDLERFLDRRAIHARAPGRLDRCAKWARRRRAVVIPFALLAVLALLTFAGGLTWSNNLLREHNEQITRERDRAEAFSKEMQKQRDIADRHLYASRIRQAADAMRARQFRKGAGYPVRLSAGPGRRCQRPSRVRVVSSLARVAPRCRRFIRADRTGLHTRRFTRRPDDRDG